MIIPTLKQAVSSLALLQRQVLLLFAMQLDLGPMLITNLLFSIKTLNTCRILIIS